MYFYTFKIANYNFNILHPLIFRAGNSLIGFLSESLVFCPKMIEWAIRSKKNERFTHSLIFVEQPERFAHNCSIPLSNLSESLMVAHFCWVTWAICSHRSFLVSRPERFTHIAHQKRRNEGFTNFFKKYV